MDAMEQLRISRTANFKNVISGKGKVDHIPHFGNYWSWKYYDAGYKLSEALTDYNKMEDSVRQFVERYPMDILVETGIRNPVKVTMPLQPTIPYIIDDDRYSLSVHDQAYMEDDEYDELIANPRKYLWEKFLPRKFSVLRNDVNNVDFRDFIMRFLEFGNCMGNMEKIIADHGMASLYRYLVVPSSYEYLFNWIRGMKDLSIDMHRRPGKVEAAIEALDETFILPKLAEEMNAPAGTDPTKCVDLYCNMPSHVTLSPKQFERFYRPGLERIKTAVRERDRQVFFFSEGSCIRFAEYFRDIPEGHAAILSELDDPREMHKALPNMVICAGPDSDLLANGTPEENIAFAKSLIEDIGGEDHRFIFSPAKMVSFPTDCKRENLLAICNYLNNLKF